MNTLQRYSRELVAAGSGPRERRDTSLVWRGQVIERVDIGDDVDETAERPTSWLDRIVRKN